MSLASCSLPQAREQHLLVRDLPDGLLIYDEDRNRAHSLNPSAALVWRHCDGKTTVSELASLLTAESGEAATEEMVWLALDHLEKAQLLQESVTMPETYLSRRRALRKLAMAGGLALIPLVSSMTAPPAARAASGGGGYGR